MDFAEFGHEFARLVLVPEVIGPRVEALLPKSIKVTEQIVVELDLSIRLNLAVKKESYTVIGRFPLMLAGRVGNLDDRIRGHVIAIVDDTPVGGAAIG